MQPAVFAFALASITACASSPLSTEPCALSAKPHLLGNATETVVHLNAQSNQKAQQVPAVNAASLVQTLSETTGDVIVVFYAPWCPHCQSFVLHDVAGNADNAPIEVLNNELIEAKGPKVVKFNTDQSAPPAGYKVEFIPTIYLANQSGKRVKFTQSDDVATLKAWALRGGAPASLLQLRAANRRDAPASSSWTGMMDAARKMSGQPTSSELSALAVTKHHQYLDKQEAKAKAAAEAKIESVSPLSSFSFASDPEDLSPAINKYLAK